MKRYFRIAVLAILDCVLIFWLYNAHGTEIKNFVLQEEEMLIDTPTSGQITVYSAFSSDFVTHYLAVFEAEYPDIEVDLVNDRTTPLTNRILTEAGTPEADVIWGLAGTQILFVEWNEILKSYTSHGLPLIDPRLRDLNDPPRWVGLDVRMLVFCVNPAELATRNLPRPESWAALIDPVYEGHIVVTDPSAATSGYLILSTVLQLYGEADGWQYMADLDRNAGEYVGGGSDGCTKVSDGEYAIAVGFGYQVSEFIGEGYNLEPIYPTEGSGWDMEVVALVNHRQIKESAKTFVDWAVSPAAMELYAQNYAITGLELDIPVPEGYPEKPRLQLLEQDFPWMAANRQRHSRKWTELYGSDAAPTMP